MIKGNGYAYGWMMQLLHWILAVLIIGMLAIGLSFLFIPNGPVKSQLIGLHKSVGMTILFLMIIRICWRAYDVQPPLPITVAPWEKIAARTVQAAFYLVLLIMPLSGWLLSSFGGHPVMVWNWFNAAVPVTKNPQISQNFFTIHAVFAWILIGLIVLHVGAALKHHFMEKNNVLRRMIPGYKPFTLENK
ncbi:MAG: cytochrome b [Proteobacteria bacterium]|nr:cytochrome b [Pseudomonadota bacterium]